jgi:glycosyltransferase involved in cell wall biosynthesis
MTQPTLSVVTVVYNGEGALSATIESVLAQDYGFIEYIVIDGNSTDRTREIASSYGQRLARFISEPDDGIYDAMNKGVRIASSEFLLFLNCGDVFESNRSVSSAMATVRPGVEQALFGRWIRRSGKAPDRHCAPDLSRGLFNHQAVVYSRSIHAWHGHYATVPGLTTADYLFFATLLKSSHRVECREIEPTLSIIDVAGVSAGLQTLSQKFAVDYLCGRATRLQLVGVLALHPVYFRLKSLLRR